MSQHLMAKLDQTMLSKIGSCPVRAHKINYFSAILQWKLNTIFHSTIEIQKSGKCIDESFGALLVLLHLSQHRRQHAHRKFWETTQTDGVKQVLNGRIAKPVDHLISILFKFKKIARNVWHNVIINHPLQITTNDGMFNGFSHGL